MLEIDKNQLLSFNSIHRARILKLIALGIIRFVGEWLTNDYTTNKTNEF